jgi:predicted transglutaminase-like cysteine proteinase
MFGFRRKLVGLVLVSLLGMTAQARADDNLVLYQKLGGPVLPPIGWVEFCADNPSECRGGTTTPRDITLTETSWEELSRINRLVNEAITPLSDMLHWGVPEKWSLPTDGYGDCEDYVLLKRKMLIDEGWPREALLVTLVRDKNDEGHAVLTVKTNKGEVILDNQSKNVMLWTETGYRFFKRQSQSDENVWVLLGDSRTASTTASAGERLEVTEHLPSVRYSPRHPSRSRERISSSRHLPFTIQMIR